MADRRDQTGSKSNPETGGCVKVGGMETVEVPTGGRAEVAFASVASRWVGPGATYKVIVAHDDGCPCSTGKPLGHCDCEVIHVVARRLR